MRTLNLAIAAILLTTTMVAQDTSTQVAKPTARKKSVHRRKSSAKSTSKVAPQALAKSTAPTTTGVKSASKKPRVKGASKKPATVARRSMQQQPTQDRYKEIQQALTDRGYFAGQPDGTWGPESMDALKRFQRDQNLTEDGKIGSLSIIALGLGPKRPPMDSPVERATPQH